MRNRLVQWPKAVWWEKAWNPLLGCKACSPACDHCYAAAMTRRFGGSFEPHLTKQQQPPRKGIVFCGNMTDLFGEWRAIDDIAADIATCIAQSGHPYLWLTKRPARMMKAIYHIGDRLNNPEYAFRNQYFGFTAENQEWYDKRLMDFKGSDSTYPGYAQFWLSLEPLLGPISLHFQHFSYNPFRWVVCGCESGAGRRPCNIEWVESIVEQCMSAKVPVFVKQLSINNKCETDISKFPAHLQIRQVPWADSEKGEK